MMYLGAKAVILLHCIRGSTKEIIDTSMRNSFVADTATTRTRRIYVQVLNFQFSRGSHKNRGQCRSINANMRGGAIVVDFSEFIIVLTAKLRATFKDSTCYPRDKTGFVKLVSTRQRESGLRRPIFEAELANEWRRSIHHYINRRTRFCKNVEVPVEVGTSRWASL